MNKSDFIIYLLIMAGVTYLLRTIPFALINTKVNNKRIKSILYYLPYTVLSCMTIPAILYATNSIVSAACALLVALFFAYKEKSLLTVACAACITVLLVELII